MNERGDSDSCWIASCAQLKSSYNRWPQGKTAVPTTKVTCRAQLGSYQYRSAPLVENKHGGHPKSERKGFADLELVSPPEGSCSGGHWRTGLSTLVVSEEAENSFTTTASITTMSIVETYLNSRRGRKRRKEKRMAERDQFAFTKFVISHEH